MKAFISLDFVKIFKYLPEINPVVADSIACKQLYKVAAAGIYGCRCLFRIGQNQDFSIGNCLSHLEIG